jgi:hypothetical protein
MFLVLCSATDISAIWAYLQLKKSLGRAIDLVTTETLVHALRWEHRITRADVSTRMTLADGRVIASSEIAAALNRIEQLPSTFPNASAADRAYAAAELHAFFASWLHALPVPLWNRATPAGLSGSTWRRQAEWNILAAEAGFATASLREGDATATGFVPRPAHTLLVVGEAVFGSGRLRDRSSAAAARALSRSCEAPLLGVTLDADGRFLSATTHPDLRTGGLPAVEALRAQLFSEPRS